MKTRIFKYLLSMTIIASAILAAIQIRAIAQQGDRQLQLSVAAEKSEYSLGEVIPLHFNLRNVSGRQIEIAGPNVYSGTIKLYVSNDGHNYAEYAGPNWGAVNAKHQTRKLTAGEKLETNATMLFNRRIATDHLTELYAERIKKERLDREFSMLEAGHYWLKATYANGDDLIRSETFEIDINEPVGPDALVWNEIKSDGAFAYFLQTGQVKYAAGSEEAARFMEKLRQITADYPQADLTERLDQNLQKYNRNVESVERLKAERSPSAQ